MPKERVGAVLHSTLQLVGCVGFPTEGVAWLLPPVDAAVSCKGEKGVFDGLVPTEPLHRRILETGGQFCYIEVGIPW